MDKRVRQAGVRVRVDRSRQKQRAVLNYLAIGYTPEDIASVMNISSGSVHQLVHQARKRMKVKTTYELVAMYARMYMSRLNRNM